MTTIQAGCGLGHVKQGLAFYDLGVGEARHKDEWCDFVQICSTTSSPSSRKVGRAVVVRDAGQACDQVARASVATHAANAPGLARPRELEEIGSDRRRASEKAGTAPLAVLFIDHHGASERGEG